MLFYVDNKLINNYHKISIFNKVLFSTKVVIFYYGAKLFFTGILILLCCQCEF